MAGKKGRSGSGGVRPGAGRPPKPPSDTEGAVITNGKQQPLEFLEYVMNNNEVDPKLRVRAAVAAAQYRHTKRSDGGKKDETGRAADRAAKGKYAPAQPPRLVVSNT